MLVLAGAPRLAIADDPPAAKQPTLAERCDALADVVGTHLKKKEYGALDADIAEIKSLYEAATEAKNDDLEAELVDLVESMAKGRHAKTTAVFVLGALADLGDPRGAKTIRHYLRQPNPKECSPELEAAVAAAAHVPDESLVESLLRIVEKSKTYAIAAEAIKSLGHFEKCKKKREKILERLVKTIKKNKPGGRPGMRGGAGGIDDGSGYGSNPAPMGQEGNPAARWSTLSPVLSRALNALTGQSIRSAEDWFSVVHRAKGHLDTLFTDDD